MASNVLLVFVRKFSLSNVVRELIRPPVAVYGLEGRYAMCLYSAATKKSNLEAVEDELIKFQELVKANEAITDYFFNPGIKRSVKADTIKAIADDLKYSEQTSNLLVLLAENGRLKLMDRVINQFKIVMAGHRREVFCDVVTAKDLDDDQTTRLQAALKTFVKPDEVLKLRSRVDSNIIGGMIVTIGDRYVNMSIAQKVNNYVTIMSAAV